MKKFVLKFSIIFLLPLTVLGQIPENFKEQLTLPDNNNLVFKTKQCADGGFVVMFYRSGFFNGNAFTKLNSDGTVLWCKEFDQSIYTNDFTLDSLNNIYITSIGPSSNDSGGDAIIIKSDPSGNILWSKSYGDSTYEGYPFIDYSPDGSLYFTSWMNSPYSLGIHLFKIDMDGNLIWDRIARDTINSAPHNIKVIAENRIAIVGQIPITGGTDKSLDVIFDKNGNLISSVQIDCGGLGFRFWNIQRYREKGVLLSGYINSPAFLGYNLYPFIAAFDSTNHLLWAKKYYYTSTKYNSDVLDLAQIDDNDYVASYFCYVDSVTSRGALMHIDSTGNSNWAKAYEKKSNGYFNSISKTNDNGFITAGIFKDDLSDRVIIIKADSDGVINECSNDSIFSVTSENIDLTYTSYATVDSGAWEGNVVCNWSNYPLFDSVMCGKTDVIKDTQITSILNIPNVFTPNNDLVNDFFKIKTENIVSLHCKIYNRWGILVEELTNVSDVWDGRTTSGEQCTDGVYYYILTAKDKNEKGYDEKGFIQLVR